MDLTKVLVVDDEVPIRENLRMFSWAQHNFALVGEARHGQEALALCRSREPDIILTDIVMPVMDGLSLTRHIKEWRPEVQVILLTCHSDFSYAREALVLGACDYLLKGTYRDHELLASLNKAKGLMSKKESDVPEKRYEIRSAVSYVNEHLKESFGIPEVAKHVGLSTSYFGALFRNETGEAFQDYVKRIRLEKAGYLLRHSPMKVYEVAAETGFPNYRYFTDVFRRQYGKCPRQYRGSDD
ncbi:response regulator transcription factor [Paenibacillus eucommiae]|uniref:YesN/AraC family two-component response regulator n=1 Tax=Paenibacillus eucommiae TaxID=1355755 RepID=A0ABS4IQ54_9BACL|nr:response regulator [Paenibacillus eucommiae]MBP1989146.1 YesN/AraC family two-component response regulator [Paenibacillus eucommiae]